MKKTHLYHVPIILLILLTSCLNYEQITTIKTDNSGELFIHFYTDLFALQDTSIISGFELFNRDSLENHFSSKYTKVNRINIFEDSSDSTLHAQIELDFQNFDSLKQTKAFSKSEFSIVDGPDDTKVFTQFVMPFITGFGLNWENYQIRYTYYLPGKIINHNANEKSNNKLVWSFTLDEIGKGKTITASYRPFRLKETPVWIYLLALTVIIVVVVFLFKKK